MATMSTLKTLAKNLLPPVITKAVQKARQLSAPSAPANDHASAESALPSSTSRGILNGDQILAEAKTNVDGAARSIGEYPIPLSKRWGEYLKRIQENIKQFTTIEEAIVYGQTRIGFDHRGVVDHTSHLFQLHEDTLKCEFPHYARAISEITDSPYSLPDSLKAQDGRLLSNMLFFQMRHVLLCLTYVKNPTVICEIGGGYAGPARAWFQNPLFRPRTYIIVDFPECLFFAETFLRANLPTAKVKYVTDSTPFDDPVRESYDIILCPIPMVSALSAISFDLVINTGSMQEMTDSWVDYWMTWLQQSKCKFFYSLNFFGQALDFMAEGSNTWSPRLTPEWTIRHQRFDPAFARQQSVRNMADILAEKTGNSPAVSTGEIKARYEMTKSRMLDGQVLLEIMDIMRFKPDWEIVWDALQRCVTELAVLPKETCWLSEHLQSENDQRFHEKHGERLREIRARLQSLRSHGQEDQSDPNAYPPGWDSK